MIEMKAFTKLLLTIFITIALYFVFYFFVQALAEPGSDFEFDIYFSLIFSAIFTVIVIPLSIVAYWFLSKQKMDKKQKNLITLGGAVIWGLLFGWISVLGIAIGQYAFEYYEERKGNSIEKK
ncbi:MAG: hypothetical protein ABH854_04595 [Candidatus Diapherotrites archaeon]